MIATVESVLRVEPGEVTLVTLNRPDALNALDTPLLSELEAVFGRIEARAIVLTGAGRAFCSGADLKERDRMDRDAWRAHHAVLRLHCRHLDDGATKIAGQQPDATF